MLIQNRFSLFQLVLPEEPFNYIGISLFTPPSLPCGRRLPFDKLLETSGRLYKVGSGNKGQRLDGAVINAYATADATLKVQFDRVPFKGKGIHLASIDTLPAAVALIGVDHGLVVAGDGPHWSVKKADPTQNTAAARAAITDEINTIARVA